MGMLRAIMWLAVAAGIEAQDGVVQPEFTSFQVAPSAGGIGGRFWPGMLHSIYGKNLGSQQSCVRAVDFYTATGPNAPEAYARAQSILPRELCGVQVLIDDEAVPLLYVHE